MTMSIESLEKEKLLGIIEDFAKNWLAHDGLWFQAVESNIDMKTAIEFDKQAWEKFTVIEARRIMKRHNIPENSGLEGLKKALQYRLYAVLNVQEIRNETEDSFEFYMVDCRVQSARVRKNMPLFPCKEVGIVEYELFAKTIDNRITTSVICCPPDPQAGDKHFCGWKFHLS